MSTVRKLIFVVRFFFICDVGLKAAPFVGIFSYIQITEKKFANYLSPVNKVDYNIFGTFQICTHFDLEKSAKIMITSFRTVSAHVTSCY